MVEFENLSSIFKQIGNYFGGVSEFTVPALICPIFPSLKVTRQKQIFYNSVQSFQFRKIHKIKFEKTACKIGTTMIRFPWLEDPNYRSCPMQGL